MGKIYDALEKRKKEKSIKGDLSDINSDDESRTLEFVGQDGFRDKLVVLSAPGSAEAESFKTLRSQILFPKNGVRKRVIMVTSVFPGEGKTFVAANLGASIAQGMNEYVMLVDCDFRSPNLHEIFGCPNRAGLHELLTGRGELPDLLIRTGVDKLSLLPAGTSTDKPSELLASIEMKKFLNEVRERYDDRFIIVDAAPIQVTSEASVLSNYVDGIVFVVMARKTPREVIKKNIEKLEKKKIFGIVFNGYEPSLKRYGYYYRDYYKK